MQEINPIARLTAPAEPSPTQQPKNQGSFNNLLEELLGDESTSGITVETGSGSAPLPAAAKNIAPAGPELLSDRSNILSDSSKEETTDPAPRATTPGIVNPLIPSAPDFTSAHAKLLSQPPEPSVPVTGLKMPVQFTAAAMEPPKVSIAAFKMAQGEIAKTAAAVPPKGSTPIHGFSSDIAGKSIVVPPTAEAIPAGKNEVISAEADPLLPTPGTLPQVQPTVLPLAPGNTEEIQFTGTALDPLAETPIRLSATSRPAAPAKNAVPAPPAQPVSSQPALVDIIGQLLSGQLAAQAHREVPLQPRSESVVLTSESSVLPAVQSADPRVPERLNLADFGVTRFEYKTEIETHLPPEIQSTQVLQMMGNSSPVRELRTGKLTGSDSDALTHDAGSQFAAMDRPAMIASPDAVQHVHLVFEPPAPPPVARSVSMDIGDPESQVRVVIRERNGSLNVQFGSSNERLRMDLQTSGPLLMRELQRNNPMAVTLDFSNFGSATDADSQPRSQSQAKKPLKPGAEFADVAETAHLSDSSPALKSL